MKVNILYLLKVLGTNKLSELVAAIDAPPIDVNLAIWEAIDRGEIEVDEDKDWVEPLKEVTDTWHNPMLANKMMRVIQHYGANQVNITKGRLQGFIKDPIDGQGYPLHEYLMTLQTMIDQKLVVEDIRSIPKTKSRPFHRFVFLCLPENEATNEDWNSREINKWIDSFKPNKVK